MVVLLPQSLKSASSHWPRHICSEYLTNLAPYQNPKQYAENTTRYVNPMPRPAIALFLTPAFNAACKLSPYLTK